MPLKINNTILNVFEAGIGNYNAGRPSLVFLHYFGGSSQSWTEVIAGLANDYHCIAPDLRGFGLSDHLAGALAVENYVEDVTELIALLELNSCVLVGHSMGGKIALALAAKQLAELHSLVLLAPSPPTPEPMPETERNRLLTTHGSRRAAEETIEKIVAHPLPDTVFERTVADNLKSSAAAWRAWLETGSREDLSTTVSNINVPVLVLAGEMDEAITAKLLECEVVEHIRGAHLIVVPDTKHLLPLEAPTIIANLIREHIEICVAHGEPLANEHEKTAKVSETNFKSAHNVITVTE